MNNDTVDKIKMSIMIVDANPKMAPHLIRAIKRNIETGSAEEINEFCEAFNYVVENTKNVPEWMREIQILTCPESHNA